jgi:GNAT superfamily N-acetyltransferase
MREKGSVGYAADRALAKLPKNQKPSMLTGMPLQIALRPALIRDLDFCKRLYFAGMKRIIEELNLDKAAQAVSFRQQWELAQVRVITLDGADIGWVQTSTHDDGFFIAQLFVDDPFQRRGIGTQVMKRLIGEAARANQPVRLNVVKINPALRLYERLGFHTTHEDDRKFYMKRDADPEVLSETDPPPIE